MRKAIITGAFLLPFLLIPKLYATPETEITDKKAGWIDTPPAFLADTGWMEPSEMFVGIHNTLMAKQIEASPKTDLYRIVTQPSESDTRIVSFQENLCRDYFHPLHVIPFEHRYAYSAYTYGYPMP